MDIPLLRRSAHHLKNLLASIQGFKKHPAGSKTNPEILKIGKGIALLLSAVLCAWISKTKTEKIARFQVMEEEWPPVQVWSGVLKQGGWTKVQSGDFSRILKNHPDPFNSRPLLWESDDHCLIFLTQSPYQNESGETELWSCATSQNYRTHQTKWRKLGSGHSGVNRLSQITIPIAKKPVSYVDPKEIRY